MSRSTREIYKQGRVEALVVADELRRTAARVLMRHDGRHYNAQHRTCWCGRHSIGLGELPVLRKVDGQGARFGNIKTCGSVWACAVCAAKIGAARQREIAHAIRRHTAAGGSVYMATMTTPHSANMPLKELAKQLDGARQGLFNSRKWKDLMAAGGSAERVASLTVQEVTLGRNGWNPHLHVLILCKQGAFGEDERGTDGTVNSEITGGLAREWAHQLKKSVGGWTDEQFEAACQRGLNIRLFSVEDVECAASYMVKQFFAKPFEDAPVGGVVKAIAGAAGGLAPFDLLLLAAAGDALAAELFNEYAEVMKGRRRLNWAPGGKAEFGIGEPTDQQIANEPDELQKGEALVTTISKEQHGVLVRCSAQGHFLRFVMLYGQRRDTPRHIAQWIQLCDEAGAVTGGWNARWRHFLDLTERVLQTSIEPDASGGPPNVDTGRPAGVA